MSSGLLEIDLDVNRLLLILLLGFGVLYSVNIAEHFPDFVRLSA